MSRRHADVAPLLAIFPVPVAGLFVVSQLLAGSATGVDELLLPTILIGLSYGGLFAISPVVCLERFGIASFATNNGILTLSPSVFASLSNSVFGLVYDSHLNDAAKHAPATLIRRGGGGAVDHAHLCLEGAGCFRMAFVVTTGMAGVAVAVAVALARRRSMQGE